MPPPDVRQVADAYFVEAAHRLACRHNNAAVGTAEADGPLLLGRAIAFAFV